jgi:hypothetical protein
MQYTKLYIGSNNETKELELDKITEYLNNQLEGYTIIKTIGYYNGKAEESCIIEIYGSYNLAIVGELKKILKQDSILVISDFKETEFR